LGVPLSKDTIISFKGFGKGETPFPINLPTHLDVFLCMGGPLGETSTLILGIIWVEKFLHLNMAIKDLSQALVRYKTIYDNLVLVTTQDLFFRLPISQ
jgi:hypothetical protein